MISTKKFLVSSLAGLLLSCSTPPTGPDTDIVAVFDMTDKITVFPSADDLLLPFGLKHNPDQGLRIKVSTINDRDYNGSTVFTLPKEDAWESNSTLRKAAIHHLTDRLQKCLAVIQQSDTSSHSIIFRAVINQAIQLNKLTTKRKLMLIFSNLYENSNINFYSPSVLQTLHDNPKRLERQLEHEVPIPLLKGLEVWLIYSAANYRDNNHYVPIAKLYKSILEAHGAIVHIDTKFAVL